jgi:hypothetical protein
MNGRRNLSSGQSSPWKREGFSALKRASKMVVARRFEGDSLLWSNKNCSWVVIFLNKKRLLVA